MRGQPLQTAKQLAILDAFGGLQKEREAFGEMVRRRSILENEKAALIVDEFAGQQEIVVKQFDGVNGSKTLFSGATILGDGSPALIVDASSLL